MHGTFVPAANALRSRLLPTAAALTKVNCVGLNHKNPPYMKQKLFGVCGLVSGLALTLATTAPAQNWPVFGPPGEGHVRPPLWLNVSPDQQATAPFTPANIQAAYGFNGLTATGAGQTIAIVDAYGSTTLLSDVNAFCAGYDGLWTLPPMTLGPGNGQLNIVGTPSANAGWAMETSLDVEWAHALAPEANIMLVVPANDSLTAMMEAVQTAAAAGANVVSMSWGSSEFPAETGQGYDSIFSAAYSPGVTFVASAGDSGEGVEYPAASPYVVAVGGTTLTDTSSGWSETAWSDSGGGLSAYESWPAFQTGWNAYSTTARGVPDVAYDANPSSGVYVYCSSYERGYTWWEVGGTSVGAPQWSALIALSGYRPPLGTGGDPALYTLAGAAGTAPIADTTYYSLIESGSNGSDTDDQANGNGAYCLVTGLGAPVANNLVPALGLGAPPPPPPPPPPAANFSISASPTSRSVRAGNSTTYTVTVTRSGGFSGSVALTTGVLPSGVTASFNPTSLTSGSSTMTVTTQRSTPTGTDALTITGTSGSLAHSTTVTLTVSRGFGF